MVLAEPHNRVDEGALITPGGVPVNPQPHTPYTALFYSARALSDIAFVCSRPFPRSQLPTLLPNRIFEVESDGFYPIE